MLKLNGLTLNAKAAGTVTVYAVPAARPGLFGATAIRRLVIETSGGTTIDAEDQIIHAEAFGGRFALAEALQKCTGAVEVAVL